MKALVVVASRHRGTHQIGAAVAATLRAADIATDVVDARFHPDPAGYDCVIVGSGVYFGRWLPAARRYVRDHATALRELPLWAFSSGPVDGPRPVDAAATMPSVLVDVAPTGHVTFGGRLVAPELNPAERLVARIVHAGTADYRDWASVTRWAAHIAASMTADHPATAPRLSHRVSGPRESGSA
jgi:menaquinone-dependent protoporphyrinogen oxidase